ncbi:hypothetical protein [Variovorax sp. KK3]|uniref:hypothetical protein n=1 Tax=Variovorax sp. KK3 TaxID=1855728 RepID=UPI00117E5169|nr:hypothetical protein [Variovorax sp. KK3]
MLFFAIDLAVVSSSEHEFPSLLHRRILRSAAPASGRSWEEGVRASPVSACLRLARLLHEKSVDLMFLPQEQREMAAPQAPIKACSSMLMAAMFDACDEIFAANRSTMTPTARCGFSCF